MTPTIDLLHATLAIATALLYTLASVQQLLHINGRRGHTPRHGVAYLAASIHLIIILIDISEGRLNLGFYKVASLIFLTTSIINLITLLIRPLHILVIVTFPLAALSVLANAFAPATGQPINNLNDGITLHISISLIAFAVLTLASLQGILVSIQTRQLRLHHTHGVIQILPPLDIMERMFYEILLMGMLLLTAAIGTGTVFIDDLLAQKILHKTVLTTVAWLAFTVILAVHWWHGWRISTALTLTFLGFASLTLGFFGSKFVTELLLT